MNKLYWYIYGAKYAVRTKIWNKYGKKKCFAKYRNKYADIDSAGNAIKKYIESGQPFMAGRVGFNEMSMMKAYDFGKKKKYEIVVKNMCDMAGFFPNELSLGRQFLEIMKSSLEQVDVLGIMDAPLEDYYANHYLNRDAIVTPFAVMDFWKLRQSWTKALVGKKVLVIHPFADSIQNQYVEHRTQLFSEEEYLPEFELLTYKAIQTAGGETDSRFANWFEALAFMESEIHNIDFDIALIGCGAYGFPLAASIKKMRKQAIHMGGVLQILFGIKGQRWTKESNSASKMMNDYWIWPAQNEVPIDPERIEGGPYFRPTESYRKRIENSKE